MGTELSVERLRRLGGGRLGTGDAPDTEAGTDPEQDTASESALSRWLPDTASGARSFKDIPLRTEGGEDSVGV
ncbi:hypothetical protein ABFW11_23455, partial [Mycolicibacterium porcinum]